MAFKFHFTDAQHTAFTCNVLCRNEGPQKTGEGSDLTCSALVHVFAKVAFYDEERGPVRGLERGHLSKNIVWRIVFGEAFCILFLISVEKHVY